MVFEAARNRSPPIYSYASICILQRNIHQSLPAFSVGPKAPVSPKGAFALFFFRQAVRWAVVVCFTPRWAGGKDTCWAGSLSSRHACCPRFHLSFRGAFPPHPFVPDILGAATSGFPPSSALRRSPSLPPQVFRAR